MKKVVTVLPVFTFIRLLQINLVVVDNGKIVRAERRRGKPTGAPVSEGLHGWDFV